MKIHSDDFGKTLTVVGEAGKCSKCKGQIHAGQKVKILRDGSYVEIRHLECPALSKASPNRKVQGT